MKPARRSIASFSLATLGLSISATALTAADADVLAGDFICTVKQSAGIAAVHLEGAPPPRAFFDDDPPTRFTIKISGPVANERRHRVVETPYSGPDRDASEWHTPNSVLHSAYLSEDGANFTATEDQAFLRIASVADGELRFWHSGFEYPGGEDTRLTARWGTCVALGKGKPK